MTDQIIDESNLTHDFIFELFESIPSDTESIIGDESDFEEENNTFIAVTNLYNK